jgi:hypothetical protein
MLVKVFIFTAVSSYPDLVHPSTLVTPSNPPPTLSYKLKETTDAVTAAQGEIKKLCRVPKKESAEAKAEWELEVTATKCKAQEAKVEMCTTAGYDYDLFCQLLKNEPHVQWDRITTEMHTKDPWQGIAGEKHNGLCMKTSESLEDCIITHKLAFFTCDAVERQKNYK